MLRRTYVRRPNLPTAQRRLLAVAPRDRRPSLNSHARPARSLARSDKAEDHQLLESTGAVGHRSITAAPSPINRRSRAVNYRRYRQRVDKRMTPIVTSPAQQYRACRVP